MSNKGFTLIEVLVCFVIIFILSTFIISGVGIISRTTEEPKIITQQEEMQQMWVMCK